MSPPDLSTLTWTTRAEVAAQLARYLSATGPPPDLEAAPEFSPRVRAGVLLGILAGPAQRDCLRSLALDPGEEIEVRQQALWALARLRVGLSGRNSGGRWKASGAPHDAGAGGPTWCGAAWGVLGGF